MLTCGLESTRAQCCVACWVFGSGSLMSGLGMWTLRSKLESGGIPGKPSEALSFNTYHWLFVTVGFSCAGGEVHIFRNRQLFWRTQNFKTYHANIGSKSLVTSVRGSEDTQVFWTQSCKTLAFRFDFALEIAQEHLKILVSWSHTSPCQAESVQNLI